MSLHMPRRDKREADVQLHSFLTYSVTGGNWSASRLGRFTLGKERPVPTEKEVIWAPEPI
jgi:hypothetical protein